MISPKKIGIFALTLVVTPLLAGLYGIFHDELIYPMSPEYYTRFKFPEFGIDPNVSVRVGLIISGWRSTWWAGLVIGLVLGWVGLMHRTPRMIKAISESILLVFVITFIVELVGLAFGGLFLPENGPGWNFPVFLVHKRDYMAVACMHSFSHVGGVIGLIAGIIYQIRQRRRVQQIRRRRSEEPVVTHSRKAA